MSNLEKRVQLLERYPVTFSADESGYINVRFPDFPGLLTGGATIEEAARHAREAFELHVTGYEAEGLALPEPLEEHSGHLSVHVPRSLHRELRRRAEQEGVSLNALVNHLLAKAVS